MEKPGGQPVAARPRSDSDWAALLGREMGDFEIVREIGRGGMGTVFQARQKSLDRVVALKVLARGLATTSMSVLRFQREAQAAARLHHSSIIPIHAQGDHDGIYYYAMELVQGENLHDVISRQRAEAQARVEAAGTVVVSPHDDPSSHSDPEATVALSPSSSAARRVAGSNAQVSGSWSESAAARHAHFENVARLTSSVADALEYAHEHGVIHRDVKPHNLILGEDGRIHIFDFGLARVLEQPGVTITGEFIGSPLYMSPEQIMGGQVRVDKRTDIYSLGATLYEWLALSPPFPGETREQVISKIITSELPAPRQHNPHIPVDLETICLKCLEKSPDRRYQSAAEMRDDLLRFLEHQSIKARRAGPLTRARKLALRHRVAAVLALAVVVAGVLMAALVDQARRSRGKEKQIAQVQETVKAKDDIVQDQQSEIERLRRSLVFGTELGQEVQAAAMSAAGQLLAPRPGDKAAVDPFAEQLTRALLAWLRDEEQRTPAAGVGPQQGAAQDLFAQVLTSETMATLETRAEEYVRLNPDDLRSAKLSAVVGCVMQDSDRMMTHVAKVIAAEPDKAGGHLLAGVAKMLSGNLNDSLVDLSRAADLAPDSTWPLTLRGFARRRLDDFVNAIRDLSGALRLAPENTMALFEKARISSYLGDYDAAIASATRLIELEQDNAEAYVFRGECYDEIQDYAAASADYQRAVTLAPSSNVILKLGWATARLRSQSTKNDNWADTAAPPTAGSQPTNQESSAEPPRETGGSSDAAQIERLERLVRQEPGRDASAISPWATRMLLGSRPK